MMKTIPMTVAILQVLFFFSAGLSDASEDVSIKLRESLRNRIEAAGVPVKMEAWGEKIHSVKALPEFYERRAFEPAWIEKGEPSKQADFLIIAIKNADKEGLDPGDYHIAALEKIIDSIKVQSREDTGPNLRALTDLELLLTDSFLVCGSHLLAGKVNPESLYPEWAANRRGAEMATVLSDALISPRVDEALLSLAPRQPGYLRLREELAKQRFLSAEGEELIPPGPALKKGDSTPRVGLVRSRIRMLSKHDTRPLPEISDLFDDRLEAEVKEFQTANGLESDGIVGPATLEVLNMTAEQRIRRIVVNLERWRWLPENLGERYVLVNVADFKLDVIEQDRKVLEMKIIVGRSYRRTPVFSDRISYLVLNPRWHVPRAIAVKDKLPVIKKDPNFLAENRMKVFAGWGAETREVDPSRIDWSTVSAKNFPYRLRQEPGPQNALGQIKFMFPNRFNVYLHDTPSRELFDKTVRTFSSGCIRIQKPLELAECLLRGDPGWSRDKIQEELAKKRERTIKLPTPIPVHLLYWTAFVDDNGALQFRNDIYGRDERLAKALKL